MRGCTAAALATLAALHAPAARADPTILIVGMQACCAADAWPEAEEAARGELAAMGLAVEVVTGLATGDRESRAELAALAARHGAVGALRIVRPHHEEARGSVEIWVEDAATHRTLVRRLALDKAAGPHLAALKAVEAVRASVMELSLTGPASRPAPLRGSASRPAPVAPVAMAAPRPVSPPPEPTRESRWAVRAAGSLAGGPGGVGPVAAVAFGAGWSPTGRLGLELDACISVAGTGIVTPAATSTFGLAMVRGWALLVAGPWRRVRLALGAGAGLAIPWSTGAAGPHVVARSDTAAVAYAGLLARAAVEVGRRVRLFLEGRVGLLAPQVRIFHGDTVAATLGRPLAETALGLELQIP